MRWPSRKRSASPSLKAVCDSSSGGWVLMDMLLPRRLYNARTSSDGGPPMTTRRDFLTTTAGAVAGLLFVGCDLLSATPARAQGRRREVVVGGKRVKTVDIHAHCAVPEALALMGLKLGGPSLRPDLDTAAQVSGRLQTMDEQGIDVQALSINPNWYKTDRDLAKQVCALQNARLA